MKAWQKISFSLLTPLLLALAWPGLGGVSVLLAIAFVPLFYLQYQSHKNQELLNFWLVYLAFVCFNFTCTYWLYNVEGGFVTKFFSFFMPSVLNAFLMSFVWYLSFRLTKHLQWSSRVICFVFAYLAFEYLHLDWDLSWTWLNLGNALAIVPSWIQFYEVTGALGGSLWVLLSNVLVLNIALRYKANQLPVPGKILLGLATISLIFAPVLWSYGLKKSYQSTAKPENELSVILAQPNVDPYSEKFDERVNTQKLMQAIDLVKAEQAKNGGQLVVFPETALQEPTYLSRRKDSFVPIGLWENSISDAFNYKLIRSSLIHPLGVDVLAGMSSDSLLPLKADDRFIARSIPGTERKYIAYNSALFLSDKQDAIYHKSKLVPGVEFTPFESLFKHLKGLALNLGGTTGSLGTQSERTVFNSSVYNYKVAPIICYESVYGDYVGEFVRNGAEFIAIMTNDAWWSNSAGHKQHWHYAKLRAIEHRRWIVRSANTGISGFINPLGESTNKTKYNEAKAISGKIELLNTSTIYTRNGDYLGRLSLFFVILFLLYSFVRRKTGRI